MKNILKYLFFFIVIAMSLPPVKAQEELKNTLEQIEQLESISDKIHHVQLLLDKENYSVDLASMVAIYENLSNYYWEADSIDAAIICSKKALQNIEKIKPRNAESINNLRYNLSQKYKRLNRTRAQNELLKRIIAEGRNDEITCNAHADLGRNIAIKGDYETALQYLNAVLADTVLIHSISNELILRDKIIYVYGLKYQGISTGNKDSKDLQNILQHHKEAERKFEQSNLPKKKKYSMLNNLANVCSAYDEGLNEALIAYYKSLQYYKEIDDRYEVFHLLSNIGTVYSKFNQHEKANTFYQQVIDNASDIDQKATAYVNMGYYLDTNDSSEKIPYLFKAFDIMLEKDPQSSDEQIFPSLNEIRTSGFEGDFLIFLIDLADILVQSFKESGQNRYLIQAKEAIYLIDELVSKMRYESLSEESKLFWIERGVDTYMLGVEVCYLLSLPGEAFYFMEKNKALLLQENIKTLQSKWEMDIPDEILQREYSLYYLRSDLYNRLLDKHEDQKVKQAYSKANTDYTALMDSLEQHFPGYRKTKKQVEVCSFENANTNYASVDQCFVEYILNDTEGFGIFCSENRQILFEIPEIFTLHTELNALHTYWSQPILTKKEIDEFQKLSYSVFSKLFPFENALQEISEKQLTVISDQKLLLFPFEALSTDTEIELAKSYLINFSKVSYLQSISVAEQLSLKKKNGPLSLLTIAPIRYEDKDLSELTYTKNAMQSLAKIEGNTILLEDDATKSNFLKNINDHNIIHLNTHAGIDSFTLEPWIAFRDEKMGLTELYGKENQADLVILDACKTNDGKLASGEGVINLSRGFFYNGAQSVLAAIWNVNEKSGSNLILTFYDYLEADNTKSEALQMAKIDYLKSAQYSEILPYYWAGYTLTGNINPLDLKKTKSFFMILTLGGIAVLVFLFWRFKS
ncbi:MAG: CHAT domain-containing tetratricopeptide repeat protein [Bacteroidota bacterium]